MLSIYNPPEASSPNPPPLCESASLCDPCESFFRDHVFDMGNLNEYPHHPRVTSFLAATSYCQICAKALDGRPEQMVVMRQLAQIEATESGSGIAAAAILLDFQVTRDRSFWPFTLHFKYSREYRAQLFHRLREIGTVHEYPELKEFWRVRRSYDTLSIMRVKHTSVEAIRCKPCMSL